MARYREDLDGADCSVPDCDHTAHDGPLYIHGQCHPGAPVVVAYEDGLLLLSCATCDRHVVEIAVASSGAPPAGVESPFTEEFVASTRTMFDMVERSAISLTLLAPGEPDVKLALETGASVLADKPMMVVALEGSPVSEHLRRVADVVVEVASIETPEGQETIRAGLFRLMVDNGLAPPDIDPGS